MFRLIGDFWKILMGEQPHKVPVESSVDLALRKYVEDCRNEMWTIDELPRKNDLKIGDRVLCRYCNENRFGECKDISGDYCGVQFDNNHFTATFNKKNLVRVCEKDVPWQVGDIVVYLEQYYEIIARSTMIGYWHIRSLTSDKSDLIHTSFLKKVFDKAVLELGHLARRDVYALLYPKQS